MATDGSVHHPGSTHPVLVRRPSAELNPQSMQPLAFITTPLALPILSKTNTSCWCFGDSHSPSAVAGQLATGALALEISGGQYSWHGVA